MVSVGMTCVRGARLGCGRAAEHGRQRGVCAAGALGVTAVTFGLHERPRRCSLARRRLSCALLAVAADGLRQEAPKQQSDELDDE
ncbi:MAG: hypothetical protein ACLUI3_02275 [Christensenellales bacterium]